jgi:hypothetical protein
MSDYDELTWWFAKQVLKYDTDELAIHFSKIENLSNLLFCRQLTYLTIPAQFLNRM